MLLHMQINLIKVIKPHENATNEKEENSINRQLRRQKGEKPTHTHTKKTDSKWHELCVSNNILLNECVCVSWLAFVRIYGSK